ncbi:MAG: FAD-containing oxidoreductase [Pseudomonadota bacterium]
MSEVPSTDDRDPLADVASRLREIVDIEDRVYGLTRTRYERCFIGTEAVQAMLDDGLAADVESAVAMGNVLIDAGVIRHVLSEHAFRNDHLFYRFTSDEARGAIAKDAAGKQISWADLLTPVGTGDVDGLQPSLPPPDRALANATQVDLVEIGVSPLDAHNAKLLDNTHPKAWHDPSPKPLYNLVVIGAGAGGLISSAAAAGLGAEVALIEAHLLGGDCLNVGCVPSKALLKSAKVARTVRNASDFGVEVRGEVAVNFPAVMERMRRLRAGISPVDSATRYSDELGVDVFLGRGTFVEPNAVEVNGQTLRFRKAIVATGGTAAIPDVPGLRDIDYLTNATVFNLTERPERLGVMGAGPIGVELAQAFAAFGSHVTLIDRGQMILRREDPEAAALVHQALVKDGVAFEFGAHIERCSKSPTGQVVVTLASGRELEFDALLVATGRKPAVDNLGLDAAGIAYDARLGVGVDDQLRTSNPDVFAVGDVSSRFQFTHAADFMARIAIRNALFFGRANFSKLLIPWATYTDPEVAHVGLYPRDLEERGIAHTTFQRDFDDVDRSILDGETKGFVKIHVAEGSDKILGATIVGTHAGDMISELTVAIQNKVGLGQLANVIHPYPTAAEAIRQCGDAYNRTRLSPSVRTVFNRFLQFQRR